MTRYLIIGGGVAGVTAAQSILPLDPAAEVICLSAETNLYYYRPRLWEYIAGQMERPALFFRQAEWYEAQKINLRLGTQINALDPAAHVVTTSDGGTFPYDRLLLATGARSSVPPLPGIEKAGVFSLRSLPDADAIRNYRSNVRSGVVVGGGLLGLETAHAIASAGLEVTVVETAPHLLPRQLDAEGAQVLQSHLENTGLHICTGVQPVAVCGETAASGIELPDGERIAGELVIFSTGIRSEYGLAQAAGLAVHRGIQVDDQMHTGDADIFAAGDAAEHAGVVYGLIQPSIEQARIAAVNMTGGTAEYHGSLASASLKIVGVEVTSLGEAQGESDAYKILRRTYPTEGQYRKLIIHPEGWLAGAILINQKENALPIKQLITSKRNVINVADRLLDPDFDFLAWAKGNPPNTNGMQSYEPSVG